VAESMNPPKAPAVPAPAPPPTPAPAAAKPAKSSAFGRTLARLMTSTFCLVMGLGFIGLGVVARLWPHHIPDILSAVLYHFFPHLPYFLVGVGLFFLAMARSMSAQELVAEYRKNRQFPHAWKIGLVSFQAFIFYAGCFIYAVPVGMGGVKPVQNLMSLVWVVFFFLLYGLWYLTEHSRHRFPAIAGFRMAVVTVVLAALSFILWAFFQCIFPALLVGILGIISLLIAILVRVKNVEQIWSWPKVTILVVSVFFLGHVTYFALPYGKPTIDLVGLTLAAQNLPGEVKNLSYFTAGDYSKDEVAFSQKEGADWNLEIMAAQFNQESLTDSTTTQEVTLGQPPPTPIPTIKVLPAFKIPAGDGEFRSLFIKNGNWLLSDMQKRGGRGLWKVNVENGKAVLLRRGIEPIQDGVPWSETRGQFLYVTQSEGKYRLNVLTLATNKSKVLLTSENPILTPSWVRPKDPAHNPKGIYPEQQVAYADGIHGLFYVVDIKTGEKEALVSEAERSLESKFAPVGKIPEVVPAPDGFRYLYVVGDEKRTEIWLVLADGTKRGIIYQTNAAIKSISWYPNGQQILFEEVHSGFDLGFFKQASTVKILDANLGRCLNLLPPQIATQSPAVASDGVKVAFVAGEGLWYPSFGKNGIWVAALR